MSRNIAAFHYLTQDLKVRSHEEQVQLACEAGVKWIQLRIKEGSENECLNTAVAVKKITDRYGVVLIINDHPFIAKEINADGVHLGQQDMNYEEARRILGSGKIIGLSAHNKRELTDALMTSADYIGIGPFRFTSTKKNLDVILGVDGIKELAALSNSTAQRKPLIAIGGIILDDVQALFEAGVDGIAISSAINLHQNPLQAIRQFLDELETLNQKPETRYYAALNNSR